MKHLVVCLIFLSQSGLAAADAPLDRAREALHLGFAARVEALKSQGGEAASSLEKIMFAQIYGMEMRWKATTALARLKGEKSVPALLKASKRKEWFMRSASVIAMMQADRQQAVELAHKLIQDKAAMVRSAAVDVLAKVGTLADAPILWKELYSSENFDEGQSMWIRRKIVESLAHIEVTGSESKFRRVLADPDETLHAAAVDALERITKTRIGGAGATLSERRDLWMSKLQ